MNRDAWRKQDEHREVMRQISPAVHRRSRRDAALHEPAERRPLAVEPDRDECDGDDLTLAVWTRDYPAQTPAGRVKIAMFIRHLIDRSGAAVHLVAPMVFARLGPLNRLKSIVKSVSLLVARRGYPLQTILFYNPVLEEQLEALLIGRRPAVVYFDGIRCLPYLEMARKILPQARCVVDMDDLMSRRFQQWEKDDVPISVGVLGNAMPAIVRACVNRRAIGRAIMRYEINALRRAEERTIDLADDVVLLSQQERVACTGTHRSGARLHVIPPAQEIMSPPAAYDDVAGFVFIGTDALAQNARTIDYLLDLWARCAPDRPLRIIGKMTRRYPAVDGVAFEGFVPDLSHAYAADSVLLAPSFIGGGIKTKVLEAFAYGCAVVGTPVSFEGIVDGDYPLSYADIDELERVVVCARALAPRCREAAVIGQRALQGSFSFEKARQGWSAVLRAEHRPRAAAA